MKKTRMIVAGGLAGLLLGGTVQAAQDRASRAIRQQKHDRQRY